MIERLQLTPTAWSEFPDVDEVRPLGDEDRVVLEEIRGVLLKHNATNRFGVALVHRHFDLKEGEILLEMSDVESRCQRIEVRPESDIADRSNVLETQWVFNGSRPMGCVGFCHYNNGHKHIHNSR